jgi:hypothetical protein
VSGRRRRIGAFRFWSPPVLGKLSQGIFAREKAMRKSIVAAVGLLATGMVWATAHADMVSYKATLTASAEVPPTTSQGTGTAAVSVDTASKEVTWSVTYTGLTGPATAAHIHCGALPGANSGVAVNFGHTLASPINGKGKMTAAQLADLAAGKCYVNIHTAANKGGEIRGQLGQ